MTNEERTKLFEDNKGLVYHLIKEHYYSYEDKEDLFQEGLIALWNASLRFEETKDMEFSSYATVVIYRQLNTLLKKRKKTKQEVLFSDFEVENNDSIENILYENLEEIFAETKESDPFIRDVLGLPKDKLRLNIRNLKKFLTKEEIEFIKVHKKKTGVQVAEELNISVSYVSKIKAKIKSKIKDEIQLIGGKR